jgi:hypothetical protein
MSTLEVALMGPGPAGLEPGKPGENCEDSGLGVVVDRKQVCHPARSLGRREEELVELLTADLLWSGQSVG